MRKIGYTVHYSTISESCEAKGKPILTAESSHLPLLRPSSASTSTTVSESNNRSISLLRRPPTALNHPHYHQPPHLLSLHHPAAAAAAAAAAARHMQHQLEGNDASNTVNANSGDEEDEEINVQVSMSPLSVFLAYGSIPLGSCLFFSKHKSYAQPTKQEQSHHIDKRPLLDMFINFFWLLKKRSRHKMKIRQLVIVSYKNFLHYCSTVFYDYSAILTNKAIKFEV